MGKFIDLTGQRFGRGLVIKRIPNSRDTHSKFLCKCDCGNEFVAEGRMLRKGITKSCNKCGKSNLRGKRFGRWTVLDYVGNGKWECVCDCGTKKIHHTHTLIVGKSLSCGCLHREIMSKTAKTHGLTKSRLYSVWRDIKCRCFDINDRGFKNYGGRGITMCNEWANNFMAFHDWAFANGYDESAPQGKCTIDRIDTNGNYCPENCRWVDMKVQRNNTRFNTSLEYNGKIMTLSQWSKELGISKSTICYRLYQMGWDAEKTLATPPDRVRNRKCASSK